MHAYVIVVVSLYLVSVHQKQSNILRRVPKLDLGSNIKNESHQSK